MNPSLGLLFFLLFLSSVSLPASRQNACRAWYNREQLKTKSKYKRIPELSTEPSAAVGWVEAGENLTLRYSPTGARFLGTNELISCTAVMVYDPTKKVGTISHFINKQYRFDRDVIQDFIVDLKKEFTSHGGQWGQAQVEILWGNERMPENNLVMQTLVAEFENSAPKTLFVDYTRHTQGFLSQGALLNLETGEIFKMNDKLFRLYLSSSVPIESIDDLEAVPEGGGLVLKRAEKVRKNVRARLRD